MRNLLAATAIAAVAFAAPAANATAILNFGQTLGVNTVVGTQTGGSTHIEADNVGITVTQILGNPVPPPAAAILNFMADSVGAATTSLGQLVQAYTGSFSIISNTPGPTFGQNLLSGTFLDAIAGIGAGLTLTASDAPGESVTFTSAFPIIEASFGSPLALSFGFTNVTPGATEVGSGCPGTDPCTLASFGAIISGNFSGNPVPEPASIALFGTALVGLGLLGRRRKGSKTDAV